MSAAEKKSQTFTILFETLLHGQRLHSVFISAQEKMHATSALPNMDEEQKSISALFSQIIDRNLAAYNKSLQQIEETLERLRCENIEDPIFLKN